MSYHKSFYIAYPADNHLRNLMNSLKILADDSQRTEAHITVRGPYKKKLSKKELEKFSKIISGEILNISKVDNFFAFNQNTVFFKIDNNEKLKKIWKKMTYNDFKPHITIYNGDDSEFAINLYDVLKRNFIPFPYIIEGLSWLEPKGELPFFHLINKFKYDTIEQIVNRPFSKNVINELSVKDRLVLISKVADYLYENIDDIKTIAHTKPIRNAGFGDKLIDYASNEI